MMILTTSAMKTLLAAFLSALLPFTFSAQSQGAEAFELGDSNFSQRPGGKEADSIVGDFVLKNDLVEAVISGALPLRRPNMSAFYGEGNETPGDRK
ncbi:MAG: hypothetical protein KC917_21055, partial [Candidatus Omnitrophica bacterium]|nr:hypothetical protein [Candidatus Omnitrophota bacterium]